MTENQQIEELESKLSVLENEIIEVIAKVQEELEYEPDEGEEMTQKSTKELLSNAIQESSELEGIETLNGFLDEIQNKETSVKTTKKLIQDAKALLTLKIHLKLFGEDEKKQEYQKLITSAKSDLLSLPSDENKRRGKLEKDISTLNVKISGLEMEIIRIGGVIGSDECKVIILQKHNDMIRKQLYFYIDKEKGGAIKLFANLYDKYSSSLAKYRSASVDSTASINSFLQSLGYI